MPIGLFLVAVLPSLILGSIILIYDRFEREPLGLLIKVFFFGALAVVPSLITELIGQYLNIFSGSLIGIAVEAFIIVAISEEFFKRWAVMKHAFKNPEFNERLDGIVYAASAALGFAAAENVSYVFTTYSLYPSIVWTRALTAVPVHLMVGITMGYYLSMSKYSTNPVDAAKYKRRSLWIPVLLHGTYDFILFAQVPILLLALIPFVIYVWVSSIKKLNRFYRESRDMHRQTL